MISLASSVQTCMRFAGKQRAFPFSSPFPPPPLFFNPLTIFLPFLFLPVQPVTTIRGWFYSILLFRKLTPPLPLFARANERGKKKKREKERLAPNGYDAAREYCSRKSPYRSTNGGSHYHPRPVSSPIFLASSSLPRLSPRPCDIAFVPERVGYRKNAPFAGHPSLS